MDEKSRKTNLEILLFVIIQSVLIMFKFTGILVWNWWQILIPVWLGLLICAFKLIGLNICKLLRR